MQLLVAAVAVGRFGPSAVVAHALFRPAHSCAAAFGFVGCRLALAGVAPLVGYRAFVPFD